MPKILLIDKNTSIPAHLIGKIKEENTDVVFYNVNGKEIHRCQYHSPQAAHDSFLNFSEMYENVTNDYITIVEESKSNGSNWPTMLKKSNIGAVMRVGDEFHFFNKNDEVILVIKVSDTWFEKLDELKKYL